MEQNKKKSSNENIYGKPEISSGHDIAVTSSEWFGAAFFYLLNLGKLPMEKLWIKRYGRRNLIVGYFIKLIFLALIIYLLYSYMQI